MMLIFTLVILLFSVSVVNGQIPTDTRKDALVASGIDGTCQMDSVVLKRYNIFPGWAECGDLLDEAKHYNPNSIVLLYNSGTDNYTTPGVTSGNYYGGVEHNWLRDRCIELGYSPEILYLHFYDDTELSGWSIPGTYSTNLGLTDSVSRAPDYLPYYEGNGIGRIIVNYANPITRQLEIEYACMVFDSLSSSMWNDLDGRSSHFDGIYLDNWMHNWGRREYGSMGRVDSGGRIAETPGSNLVYGTEEFAAWYWEQMKEFSTALRDTLMQGASWTPDSKRKYLAINVGQSWNSDYTNPNLSGGDFVVMEYLYSPIRNPNTSIYGLPGMTTKDSLCALNGASLVYCSRQEIGDNGEYSWGDAVYNNMVSFYTLTSGDSYLFQRAGLGAPYTAQYNQNFDSLAWRGCMDYDLGNALGHYTVKQTGTDPTGQSYTVFEREYQKGKVLMRPLDDWGQTFADNTKITVPLPAGYRKLNVDGSLGPVLTSVELQNGAGAILIPADIGDCTSPPSTPTLYSPSNGEDAGVRPTLCLNNSNPGVCLVGLTYGFQISTTQDMSNIVAEQEAAPEGTGITCYTTSIDLNPGTYYWRGRAYNGTAYSGWSAVRSFTVAGTADNPPLVPALSSPNGGATVSTLTPTLSLYNSYDADGDILTYHFQVSSNPGFTSIIAQAPGIAQGSGATTSWTVPSELVNVTTYYWRARAYDGSQYSGWSGARSFIVSLNASGNNPPNPPQAYLPRPGDSVIGVSHQLVVFNADDPDGDPLAYEFNICSDSNMNQVVDHADDIVEGSYLTTSYTTQADFVEGGTYYWQARVYDGQDYSAWTEKRDFIHYDIASSAEDIPIPLSPLEGDRPDDIRPQFIISTEDSDIGVNFYFEAADNPDFNMPIVSGPVKGERPATIWIPDTDFRPNTGYFWRVRAEKSGWSNSIGFRVEGGIHVYPNPYKPFERAEGVIFKNIPEGADIKIVTINGDIIKEFTDTQDPEIQWNVTNDQGSELASGVYLYYVYFNGAVFSGKLAVIR